METTVGCSIEEMLAYRFRFYDLLRRIFLWKLPPGLFSELVSAANQENDETSSECAHEAALKGALKGVLADQLMSYYRDIEIEYTRLFLGPRHLPAPPYESVYRSPQKLMMQDVTIDVRSTYRDNGFQVSNLNQEPDDTIGIELEFMCALSGASVDAYGANDTKKLARLLATQREFCDLHLSKWVPQFCDDIARSTQSGFWKGVAQCTREFVQQELVELETLCASFPISPDKPTQG